MGDSRSLGMGSGGDYIPDPAGIVIVVVKPALFIKGILVKKRVIKSCS